MSDEHHHSPSNGPERRSGGDGGSGRGGAEETRRKLVDAALDAFGRYGFDGASTRDIARRAGVNLAAIPYHFGGKEGLHTAVAEHILEAIRQRIGPLIERMTATLDAGAVSPDAATAMLRTIVGQAADTLLGHPEAQRWAPYILREQMDPTPAFNVLYDGFMGRAHVLITSLFACATGRDSGDPETIVRVFGVFGQLVIFRMGRAMVERRLGWTNYGPAEVAMVKAAALSNLDAMIEAGRA
jgi:TetR/AcrR family transcriptional regulator, regulator of cefoperazone and chloramphenicol sensitivity